MTPIEWVAFIVLMVVGVAAGAAFTLSNGAVTRAIWKLEKTFRRQKSLELEQLEAQVVVRRQEEVKALLDRVGGWQQVLDQLLADALPETGAQVEPDGLLDVNVTPAPRFNVAGKNGCIYLFTTSPGALRKVKLLDRKNGEISLDATLHPAARVEVQEVWNHLSAKRLGDQSFVLPRQAEWFLVVRQKPQQKGAR
jgi:hypothetical protein